MNEQPLAFGLMEMLVLPFCKLNHQAGREQVSISGPDLEAELCRSPGTAALWTMSECAR